MIFYRAKAAVPPEDYGVELGWTFVCPSQRRRGLAGILKERLLPYAGSSLLYATARADNVPALRGLARHGFRREGVPYRSTRGDYDLVLLVRPAP